MQSLSGSGFANQRSSNKIQSDIVGEVLTYFFGLAEQKLET